MSYLDMHKCVYIVLVLQLHVFDCCRLDADLVIQAHLDESEDECTNV